MDKKKKRNLIIVFILMVLGLLLYLTKDTLTRVYHSVLDTRTEIGHVMLSELANTERLSVLSLYKEVIVSQYKEVPGLFFGTNLQQIHSVYPGRIDVGFDLTKCTDDWLLMREDTAFVKLPAVEILNQGGWYLDEAAHQTPIEDGEWTNEDYVRLAHRANALVKRNCELENCYQMAEENGRRVVRNLLQAMGIKFVKVEVEPRDSYRPFTIDFEGSGSKGMHYEFYTSASNGSKYVKIVDGSTLFYQGDIDDEDLFSVIDMFIFFIQSRGSLQWKVSKQGNRLIINMVNMTLTKGTQAADTFVRTRKSSDVERLQTALRQLFGENLQLTITEVDSSGKQLYQY
ncbi:MAG: DUF4230 domain-containing protein [Bacteroidaceae bacterium]|nr:DUF4230 domain-containing protein [Bacteroidaceae bacterium]